MEAGHPPKVHVGKALKAERAQARVIVGPGPARRLRPHLVDPPQQQLEVGPAGSAEPPRPSLCVQLVGSLLLEDLPRPLGERLERAVPSARHERGEDAVDDEVRRDERRPVGKLVREHPRPWELYDIDVDRAELHDEAAERLDVVAELTQSWAAWANRIGVIPWERIVAPGPWAATLHTVGRMPDWTDDRS